MWRRQELQHALYRQVASFRRLLRLLGCMKIDYLLVQVVFFSLEILRRVLSVWTILGQFGMNRSSWFAQAGPNIPTRAGETSIQ